MGRLGIPTNLWPSFLKEIRQSPRVEIEGILSHFAMTDEGGTTYTQHQWNEFQKAIVIAREFGISFKYLHMASSAPLATFPFYSGDLVRPGIMLYGSYPCRSFSPYPLEQKPHTMKDNFPSLYIFS
jgi:alanine racemase